MNAVLQSPEPGAPPGAAPARKKWNWRRFGGKFLIVSIGLHLLFGVVAAYYVVQVITANRKLTFKGGPPSPNPSQRALEHKVQMAKKQNTMSAPVQAKRITTTGLSKIALPDMPAMPSIPDVMPGKMAGMGGAGLSLGVSGGTGGGSGSGGGGPVTTFGFQGAQKAGTLIGVLYDTKQGASRKPIHTDRNGYLGLVKEFTEHGYIAGKYSKYYKAPNKIYATQIFTPLISANDAPKAFRVEREVQGALWLLFYKGRISPPKTATYRFAGWGDDVLAVRMDGKLVLEWDTSDISHFQPEKKYTYDYGGHVVIDGAEPNNGFYRGHGHGLGSPMQLEAGKTYDFEAVLGETDGGVSQFQLFVEEEGVSYSQDSSGNPVLPILRFSPQIPDSVTKNPDQYPPFMKNGPVWTCQQQESVGSSLFPDAPM